MRKLQGAIAAGALATAALAASPASAAVHTVHHGGPSSIIGDITQARFVYGDGQPGIALDAAAMPAAGPSCSWKEIHVINRGNAGNIQVYLNTQTGCEWWARVTCANTSGSTTVVRDSSEADGEANRTAGCDSGWHPIHGGWRGGWNSVYHQDF